MSQTYNATQDYQDLLLAALIRHPDSFTGYDGILHYGYFTGVHAQNLAKMVLDILKTSGKVPSFTTIGQILLEKYGKSGETDQSTEMTEYLQKLAAIQIRQADLEHAVTYSVTFAKEKALIAAAVEVVDSIQNKKDVGYDIIEKFQAAMTIGANMNDMGYWLHSDVDKVIEKVLSNDYGIFTGIELLDKIWKRGWGPGWLIVPLAPPKRYKSLFCVNLALSMISPDVRSDVFYYALEITAELAALRAYQNIADGTLDEFYDPGTGKQFIDRLHSNMEKRVYGNLLFKHFPSGKASISDIRAHAMSVINATGIKPKCIIIDYAETVKVEVSKGVDIYQAQADVYVQARALGSELGCCVVMPERCNRETISSAVPDMTSFQGHIKKAGAVDIMFGLCATDEEYVAKIWRLFVVLNRHGAANGHLRGNVDPEKMVMVLNEELEYDELQAMKANANKGKKKFEIDD